MDYACGTAVSVGTCKSCGWEQAWLGKLRGCGLWARLSSGYLVHEPPGWGSSGAWALGPACSVGAGSVSLQEC